MLVQWVIFHTLVLVFVLQKLVEVLMKPEKRVCWSTLLVILLEVDVFLRIGPVVRLIQCQQVITLVSGVCNFKETYVLSRTSSATATCGRCSLLSVRAFGMLLLYVGVQCRIAQISLHAIVAFKVAPLHIIFGPPLTFSDAIFVAVLIIIIILLASIHIATVTILWLLTRSHHLLIHVLHLLMTLSHRLLLRHVLSHHVLHAHHLTGLLNSLVSCGPSLATWEHLLHHLSVQHSTGHLCLSQADALHVLLLESVLVLNLLVVV